MSLVVDSLRKEYSSSGGSISVLSGISLNLEPGDAVAILGPSGSGKSTFLHILGALDRPTSGFVKLAGEDPFAADDLHLAAYRNRRVGFVFQDHHLLPQCSVLENVLIPTLINRDQQPRDNENYARELLDRVGLSARLDHRPAKLSGGERQRAAVARALINKPALLLADEPTGNLDRTNARIVGELLLEMHRMRNDILIVVTHSVDLAKLFPRRYEMNDGKLKVSE